VDALLLELELAIATPPIATAMAATPAATNLAIFLESMERLLWVDGGIHRASRVPLGLTQEEAGTFLRAPRR
jgi:hypothetical protein